MIAFNLILFIPYFIPIVLDNNDIALSCNEEGGMMLTKKTFYDIARILRTFRSKLDGVTYYHLITAFADYFQSQNPHFDRERFIKTCHCDHLPEFSPTPELPSHLQDNYEILPF